MWIGPRCPCCAAAGRPHVCRQLATRPGCCARLGRCCCGPRGWQRQHGAVLQGPALCCRGSLTWPVTEDRTALPAAPALNSVNHHPLRRSTAVQRAHLTWRRAACCARFRCLAASLAAALAAAASASRLSRSRCSASALAASRSASRLRCTQPAHCRRCLCGTKAHVCRVHFRSVSWKQAWAPLMGTLTALRTACSLPTLPVWCVGPRRWARWLCLHDPLRPVLTPASCVESPGRRSAHMHGAAPAQAQRRQTSTLMACAAPERQAAMVQPCLALSACPPTLNLILNPDPPRPCSVQQQGPGTLPCLPRRSEGSAGRPA